MSRVSRIVSFLAVAIAVSCFAGCATFHSPFGKKIPKASMTDPVIEIVCIWQPGDGTDPDGVPCKGFTGQVLFFTRGSFSPVEVEGDVRVYLFDDQGTPEEQAKPLRQFDFDDGAWSVHFMDSPSFGPSYRVFIPYVRRGVSNADCSLRVRLKPKKGAAVFSDFTNMPLNGYSKSTKGEKAKPITQEDADKAAAEAMTSDLRKTTTIPLTPPKKVELATTPKIETNSNPIQLASHEVMEGLSKGQADAERIRRLESMVQQLLEQQSNPPARSTPPLPSKPKQLPTRSQIEQILMDAKASEMDSETSESETSSERVKMNRRIRPKSNSRSQDEPAPGRRRAHPLNDQDLSSDESTMIDDREMPRHNSLGNPIDTSGN